MSVASGAWSQAECDPGNHEPWGLGAPTPSARPGWRRLPVRITWSEIAQATFVRFMAGQAGMMAVNRAVEALADDPAPPGAFARGAYCRRGGSARPRLRANTGHARPPTASWETTSG